MIFYLVYSLNDAPPKTGQYEAGWTFTRASGRDLTMIAWLTFEIGIRTLLFRDLTQGSRAV
jgi:hypothetical protein